MDKETKYIASCSFGKDSIATILLALEKNEPLDRVVSVEVMFDSERGISGEIPEHIEWVYGVAKPKLEGMGVKVDMVKTSTDLMTLFHKKIKSSSDPSRLGKYWGFPMGGMCYMNNLCKVKAINDYLKKFEDYELLQYVGIAYDEPIRLARLEGTDRVSLLEKYRYTEKMAMDLCKEYDLVSPLYKEGYRGGCWFCPNSRLKEFCSLRKSHPELWEELRQLDKEGNRVSPYFKWGKTFKEIEHMMDDIDAQLTLF